MTIKVTSPAFEQGGMIPRQYSGFGGDISPPLQWEGVPEGTKSLAVICDDPDAPGGVWVHWIMWNIPSKAAGLAEKVPTEPNLTDGSRQGINDFRRRGYGGPTPPSGTHRYLFKVYALDTQLNLAARTTKADLLKAMQGHILGQGELMGKYGR
jgi:Raf kinase inhibitor-like YbhB/YbcL family protein